MSAGELTLRHFRCCVVNGQPPGFCQDTPQPGLTFRTLCLLLRAIPRPLRSAAFCLARVGHNPKTPKTSWRTLARRRKGLHRTLARLRLDASAAAQAVSLLCR